MPNVAIDSLFQILYDGRLNGQQVLLTTYWKLTNVSAFDPPTLADFQTGISDFCQTAGELDAQVAAVYSEDLTTIKRVIQPIYPTRYVRYVSDSNSPDGTVAQVSLPQNVSCVITLRTDDTGRTQRSNKHLGGVPVTFVTDGLVNPVGAGAYQLLADYLAMPHPVTLGVDDFSIEPVILHRANPVLSPTITNGYYQSTSRIERRRTVGLGS